MGGDIYEGVADNDPCGSCLRQDCVCGGDGMSVDVTRVRPGDRVVYACPGNGRPKDREAARAAGLVEGRAYSVARVDLGDFSCRLRLAGMGWFNSVLFEAE